MKPRLNRLFYDLETSPNVALVWRAGYKLDVSHDSIIKERAIITIAWKWEGEKKVHALTWDREQCDKTMLAKFLVVLAKADEAVAHFGDGFDWPWIRTRCLFHRLKDVPMVKTVDTKAWASRNFYFNSNKLDYIARFLGSDGKIKTEYGMWKDIVLKRCPKAMAKMVKYNRKDVQELEFVHKILMQSVPAKTHAGVLNHGEKWSCPRCASEDVGAEGKRVTLAGTVTKKMRCKVCLGFYAISPKSFEAYMDTKKK